MSDEQEIAALREEIRQAGERTLAIRRAISSSILGLAFFVVWACFTAHNDYAEDARAFLHRTQLLAAMYGFGGLGAAVILAYPAALAYRTWRRSQLRRQLASLTPNQRADVLSPLLGMGRGDARKIVEPLLREFHPQTEVTLATVPAARGDEASPAENEP